MSERPLVSILMPSYNHERFVGDAIESVLAQTYPNIELIACDDASSDRTGRIIEDYAERYPDKVRVISHQHNRGVPNTWNDCLSVSRGSFIAPFASDDQLPPTAIETRVDYLLANPQIDVLATDFTLVTGTDSLLEGMDKLKAVPQFTRTFTADWTNLYEELLLGNFIPGNTVMMRLGKIDRRDLTEDPYCPNLSDYDLWLRLARTYRWALLQSPTCLYRWHETNYSSPVNRNNTQAVVTRQTVYILAKQLNSHSSDAHRTHIQNLILLYIANLTSAEHATPIPVEKRLSGQLFTASIIIPTWNKVELTRQCLTALASNTTDISFEVIIVDNGSTDGTPDFLNTLGGDVQVILNKENLGFAKACNQGAQAARGRYLVFLNNDTIPQPRWLQPLVGEVDEHPEVGVVGSKLLYANGSVQHAGVVFMRSYRSAYHVYRSAPSTIPAVNQRREFQAVTAACMLIRREAFEAVHGFDESFVNGFEDVDLCLRVREQGYQVIYQPRSVLYHLESQTPGRHDRDEYNSRLFKARWGSHWWLGDEDFHYYMNGFVLLSGPDNERFATQLRPISDVHEQAAWAHVAATQAAALKKDWEAVRRELRMADDWPHDRFVLSWGAMVCEHLQEPALQVKFLARYLEFTENLPVRLQVVHGYLERQDFVAADLQLQKLLSECPAHAEGLLLKGVLGMQREQYTQAEQAFDSALREGADRKKCLMGMGMAAMGRAYTQGAWERFLQVLAEYPDDAEAIHWLLRAGTAQNRWQELGHHLRSYVARNPGDVAARFAFASVLLRGEQIEEARREHDALRHVVPSYDGLDQLGQAIAGREAALAMASSSFVNGEA